jgi:hypothetical protein
VKRFSASLNRRIRIKIKITMKFYLTPVRMDSNTKTKIKSVAENKTRESFLELDEMYSHYGN